MPASYDYADRICARLPRVLQELREGRQLSKYALWRGCGVSRDMIGRIEDGESIPTLHAAARLAHGLGATLATFVWKPEGASTPELTSLPDGLVCRHDSRR